MCFPWTLRHEIVLRVVIIANMNFRIKFEYPSNQQEIIYRMSLIFSKPEADSWGTCLVSITNLVIKRDRILKKLTRVTVIMGSLHNF